MRSNRRYWPLAALLLALILPLQGFAAVAGCPQAPPAHGPQHSAQPAHMHCAAQSKQNSPAQQHHGFCSDCCMAAMAPAAPDWIPPPSDVPHLSLPLHRAPVMIPLDRLDRPPRATA
jgi:hypothetical protein